jgi:hypothetical protein
MAFIKLSSSPSPWTATFIFVCFSCLPLIPGTSRPQIQATICEMHFLARNNVCSLGLNCNIAYSLPCLFIFFQSNAASSNVIYHDEVHSYHGHLDGIQKIRNNWSLGWFPLDIIDDHHSPLIATWTALRNRQDCTAKAPLDPPHPLFLYVIHVLLHNSVKLYRLSITQWTHHLSA